MHTRRTFLTGTAALFGFALAPAQLFGYAREIRILDARLQSIRALLPLLLPAEDSAPGSTGVNAFGYLLGVFEDPGVPDATKRMLKEGADFLNDISQKRFHKPFYLLSYTQKPGIIEDLLQNGYGERWLWRIYSYLFEALLGDPVYGANTGKAGWRWLGHASGLPRPKRPYL